MTQRLPSFRAAFECKASDEWLRGIHNNIVPVMVVLGSPSSQCQGQGICYIQEATYGAVSVSACQRTTALASLKVDRVLQLQFNLRDMCPGALKKHFNSNILRVEEEAPMHIPTLQCVDCLVPKGNYRIWQNEDSLFLQIPLSNKM